MKELIYVFMVTLSFSASAACTDDAEVARKHFASIHGQMSEVDHVKAEEALGLAYSLCAMGLDTDAAAKLAEVTAILANYPVAQTPVGN